MMFYTLKRKITGKNAHFALIIVCQFYKFSSESHTILFEWGLLKQSLNKL